MSDELKPSPPPGGQFLVYRTEDGRLKLDVRFEGETVWLTQPHMAELFQTTQQNISLHLQNIYAEGELERGATHKESLSVRQEGGRSVQRRVDFYNLDAILSVGYRVKSAVAKLAVRYALATNGHGKQQSFLDFVLQHYVTVGVEELDQQKLTPLLRLKYDAIQDAVADLGHPEEIGKTFVGFQKYLYAEKVA